MTLRLEWKWALKGDFVPGFVFDAGITWKVKDCSLCAEGMSCALAMQIIRASLPCELWSLVVTLIPFGVRKSRDAVKRCWFILLGVGSVNTQNITSCIEAAAEIEIVRGAVAPSCAYPESAQLEQDLLEKPTTQ